MLRRTSMGWVRMSNPATRPVPLVGTLRVVSIRTRVVLPAPLGPSRPSTDPSGTTKLTPSTARVSPKCLTRSMASTAAVLVMPTPSSPVLTSPGTGDCGGSCSQDATCSRLEGKRILGDRAKIVAMTDPRAGQPAAADDLIDVAALVTAYYTVDPDPAEPAQQVSFGTSGHRGSAFDAAFNEAHILATTQAICEYRAAQGYDGPLFVGKDTHALSAPAWTTALEVLVANDVTVLVDAGGRFTPTPAVSHAILRANRGKTAGLADGIVVTPSHNPPRDGGFKYNPPSGGPADTDATKVIADRANQLLFAGLEGVRRVPFERAQESIEAYDFLGTYVDDLRSVLDLDAIRSAGVRIGADPLGGTSVDYWAAIAERHGLGLTVVNPLVDPTWRFMTLDWDGKIRMDCSSPSAMASLVGRKDDYDIATGNDADADRHGIVTPDRGLMNPNHFLAVAIAHLFGGARPGWSEDTRIGKTLVSSSMIDRVAESIGKPLVEVPVGFKWFVPGLLDGSFGFGGEESAGASFLRRDGSTWT